MYTKHFKLTFFLTFLVACSFSQIKKAPKYPSLLWEISGNGLTRPSYLFGTMHVSNKIAFHLSDSFYYAIKNVDAVALELNPEIWQNEMVRLEKSKQNYYRFTQPSLNNYLTQSSFKIDKYEDELKLAISGEPTSINSLLYRTYKSKEDFEEDTFLDLYIFQTGKKLGKRSAGVENYFESEKIVIEAYSDMAKEKQKNNIDLEDESMYDIQTKIQDAYRKNDLDLMDSLSRKTERSNAFREKFLYKRNEIQANSIDTILRKNSLFVGVGAAHLPGSRGVIELLRQKGYTLRPIIMDNRDALQKETIDKLKVPVPFINQQSEDGFYTLSAPGRLYSLKESYQALDRRQFSDMANGCYYLVTRVKTHAAFIGQTQQDVLKKIDSLFYENIPGKIISKKNINNNGYPGYDVINKTRRGDLQRYNIFTTPFETIIFKMGGKEDYIKGKEAETFFSSIQLKQYSATERKYTPPQGGFTIQFPAEPATYHNNINPNKWEYTAIDKSGNVYLIFKKTIYNHRILEEDTFDLSMIEESFRSADFFDKQLHRSFASINGYPFLTTKEKLKDGTTVFARYFVKGAEYYVVAARVKLNANKNAEDFLNSFQFIPYQYHEAKKYVDTFMHFSVNTSVVPLIDEQLKETLDKAGGDEYGYRYYNTDTYWPKSKSGYFENENTGEAIAVDIQTYPKYFYIKDSVEFWKDEMNLNFDNKDLLLYKSDSFSIGNSIKGYKFYLRDTGSSKQVNRMLLLQDNVMYNLINISDTAGAKSSFIDAFFNTFLPSKNKQAVSIAESKTNIFFQDLFSTDSLTRSKAIQAISSVNFTEGDIPILIHSINSLKITDKNYLAVKSGLIAQLGFIKDTTKPIIVDYLKKMYEQTADTSLFQNVILSALVQHQTTTSFNLFKDLILQDPPVMENTYNYDVFLRGLSDSLSLTAKLFPDFLQLTTLEDYKPAVLNLLVKLLDSGYIKPTVYESYLSKIFFDAKIEFKKQLAKDSKLIEAELKDEDNVVEYDVYNRYKDYYDNNVNSNLYNSAVLLMPFYDSGVGIKKMMDKLLLSKDPRIQLDFAILLLKNNKKVPDSIFSGLADKKSIRADLFAMLQKIKRLDKFPVRYKNQLEIARAFLIAHKSYVKIDSTIFVGKQLITHLNKKGNVYFFKYRTEKSDDWKIGFSGILPNDEKKLDIDKNLIVLTDKKLKDDEPVSEQFQKQLKRSLFSMHKGGKYFYEDRNYAAYDYYDD